jgi:hypothetical protein
MSRATSSPAVVVNGGYIAGPLYDHAFFILAPLAALALGFLAVRTGGYDVRLSGRSAAGALMQVALPTYLSAAFTHAHLAAVFVRSHGDRRIFDTHRLRFTVVPLAVLAALLLSQWAFVAASVLVVWWDVYHSSLQTFGLGRIYDARHGNGPQVGRRADYLFNLLIYVGPVVAGLHLAPHLAGFARFSELGAPSISTFAAALLTRQAEVRVAVLGLGLPAIAAYVLYYARASRRATAFRGPSSSCSPPPPSARSRPGASARSARPSSS